MDVVYRLGKASAAEIHAALPDAPTYTAVRGLLRVLVEKGQEVQAGDVICILEAMKMENHIPSPREGEVTDLPIHAGQVVDTDQLIAVID